ncbi:hypothetical protein KY329_02685, partial [Candidatus Woesearchaeota archaeon]|nr:hypothetical protein [Candidatus Woesearchaeota archaeon]
MLAAIVALIAFLVFLALVSLLFAVDIFVVGINVIILYFTALKVHADLTKRKMFKEYGIAAAITAVFILLVGNFLPLWWITTVA